MNELSLTTSIVDLVFRNVTFLVDLTSILEIAASSGVATSSQEEVLEIDQDQDQELDVDDDEDISEGLDEGEGQDLPENLEVMTDDDNGPEEEGEVISEEEIEVEQPEDVVEDNSSEPSSSTGTRQPARALAAASSGYEEQGESDGVVPTTPKLPLPRRNDGFAEAVSSPQVNCL